MQLIAKGDYSDGENRFHETDHKRVCWYSAIFFLSHYIHCSKTTPTLILLHSEWPKLYRVLAILSVVELNRYASLH